MVRTLLRGAAGVSCGSGYQNHTLPEPGATASDYPPHAPTNRGSAHRQSPAWILYHRSIRPDVSVRPIHVSEWILGGST